MPRPNAALKTVLHAEDLEAAAAFYVTVLQLDPVHGDEHMKVLRMPDQSFSCCHSRLGDQKPDHSPRWDDPATRRHARDPRGLLGGTWRDCIAAELPRSERRSGQGHHKLAVGAVSLHFRDQTGNHAEIATANHWED
jgi:hypothetical protein